LIQYRSVTDTHRQTDRHTTTAYTALSKASRGKKMSNLYVQHGVAPRLRCGDGILNNNFVGNLMLNIDDEKVLKIDQHIAKLRTGESISARCRCIAHPVLCGLVA